MVDRIPKYPGRISLTPVQGQANIYDMVRADEPIQEGTPLNVENLLTADTASLFGKGNDATINDIFNVIGNGLSKIKTINIDRSLWVADSTMSGFRYKAELTVEGLSVDSLCMVIFEGTTAFSSFYYCAWAKIENEKVTVWGNDNYASPSVTITYNGALAPVSGGSRYIKTNFRELPANVTGTYTGNNTARTIYTTARYGQAVLITHSNGFLFCTSGGAVGLAGGSYSTFTNAKIYFSPNATTGGTIVIGGDNPSSQYYNASGYTYTYYVF